MHTHTRLARRVGLALLAASLLAAWTTSAASAAGAAGIDQQRTGSITVTKNRSPQDGASPQAIAGVEFTVERLATYRAEPVDLSTSAGWQTAQAFLAAPPSLDRTAAATFDAPEPPRVTDRAGQATFALLPLGVYRVSQTDAPAGVAAAQDFWVSIPFADPVRPGAWLYDVAAYPKSDVESDGTKTVSDLGAVGPVTWTVAFTVPPVPLTSFTIRDELDPRLAYVADQVPAVSLVTADQRPPTAFTPLEYVVTHKAGVVQLEFTDVGIARLMADDAVGATVVLTFETTVTGTGAIANAATADINRNPTLAITTDSVETHWGRLEVMKADRAGRPLAGAVFEVWAARVQDFTAAKVVAPLEPTDGTGRTSSGTLRHGTFANGGPLAPGDDATWFYWLVEVQAPAGYARLTEPIPFTVDSATTTLTVTNVQIDQDPTLPQTGGAGTWPLTLGALSCSRAP
ncbi:hypothetical protein ET495_03795 [Xylanimonas allomyrinae]|uniref:Prealbumin-like fold domain-containing protein n=1 Tax=Xylanimonas allomyrinae TaxID=2509459 RepID=A0A4P6EIU4_9MICO|nr:SpaH/EbpB family LPXTG-anchored major pilin [Xylanimonas allomyrinae]QAY62520.1 hypothetical protein ET495_03795 [Xylanimonas allomyrinae]